MEAVRECPAAGLPLRVPARGAFVELPSALSALSALFTRLLRRAIRRIARRPLTLHIMPV
ncbi:MULTISPECIES: hypothetical protein [unclassified Streptomyces]|uniref:hypothetical protein n=1 Tax=unclassified Streptomyces TaxID=2593676 RepID=UPI0035E082C9